jgi:hypothetical protein
VLASQVQERVGVGLGSKHITQGILGFGETLWSLKRVGMSLRSRQNRQGKLRSDSKLGTPF